MPITTQFPKPNSFHIFSQAVLRKHRYARDRKSTQFLKILLEQAQERRSRLRAGTIVWRAQLGGASMVIDDQGNEISIPFGPERMKPRPGRASEGRANPKGISYLYTATHEKTAMLEIRPWRGSLVTLAKLKLMRPLTVVDCVVDCRPKVRPFKGVARHEWDQSVWWDVGNAFSAPIVSTDDSADYAPSQIIAESFMLNGFDGIRYRSGFGEGHNIVLFDLHAADVVGLRSLYSVVRIDAEFRIVGDSSQR